MPGNLLMLLYITLQENFLNNIRFCGLNHIMSLFSCLLILGLLLLLLLLLLVLVLVVVVVKLWKIKSSKEGPVLV